MGPCQGPREIRVGTGSVRELLDPPFGFEAGHGLHGDRAGQPVQRGERAALRVDRMIPDDQRMAAFRPASGDDHERRGGLTSELLADRLEVGLPTFAHGGQAPRTQSGRRSRSYRRLWSMDRRKST